MGVVAEKSNNKLPDGRAIRVLTGGCNQVAMFRFHKSGLYVPAQEGIMSVKEYDQLIQSGAYTSVNVNGWCRTNEYGFYPRGFEKQNLPIGEKIVYVENGVAYTLNVPDVPVEVNSQTIGLRAAIGMGVIKLEKLQYDEDRKIVSVTSDFDPATDVSVKNIMRPREWALVDAEGYPMRDKPSKQGVPEARYSYVRHEGDLEKGSTGYHGSLARVVGGFLVGRGRGVVADYLWLLGSGVAVVSRAAGASRDDQVAGQLGRPKSQGDFDHGCEATAPLVNDERKQLIISLLEATGVRDLGELNSIILSARAELNDLLRTQGPESLPALRRLLKILELPGLYPKNDCG